MRLRALVDSQVALRQPTLGFLSRNQVAEYVYFSLYRQGVANVIQRLDSGIRGFRNFTARQPQQSTRVAELQSAVSRARKLVDSIEGEITQHDLNVQASLSEIGIQIRIRQEPQLNPYPVEPNKLKLMAMGVDPVGGHRAGPGHPGDHARPLVQQRPEHGEDAGRAGHRHPADDPGRALPAQTHACGCCAG